MRQLAVAVLLWSLAVLSIEAWSEAAPASSSAAVTAPAAKPASPKTGLERAYRLKDQNRDAEALAAFNAFLKKHPGNQAAEIEAGYLHVKLRQFASGAKRLSAASTREPDNMQLRMDLAYAYQSLKKSSEAEEQFRIVASKPGEFQAAGQLAADEISRQRSDEKPEAGERRALLEKGYAAAGRGDKDAARRVFEALLAADPKDAEARKQMGYFNFEDGRYADAAADFEAALAVEPNDHVTALQLGYTFEHLKKREQARASFTAALQSGDDKIREAAQDALRSSSDDASPAAPL